MTEKTTKNIQRAANEIHDTFASAYAIGEKVSHDWLTTTLTQLVKEVEAGEREYAIAIIEKYEAMPFAPTTFARIKSSLTPPTSN